MNDLANSMNIDFTKREPTWILQKVHPANFISKPSSTNNAVNQEP